MSGHVYKRCTCPAQRGPDGRKLNCQRSHGSWTFVAWLPEEAAAARQQHTKGGFPTKKDAEVAMRAFLATIDTGQVVLPTKVVLSDYLAGWLDAVEPSLAATASSNYRIIVRCYVLPHLGSRRLASLRPDHLISAYPAGQLPVLEEVKAQDEAQLQELLKAHPELIPLEDLGLAAPALVVGRESVLDSGRIDLVLLANGGELVLVEFKTGPQNPDFRECLAQLLDYGSDLWGMTLEDFDTRVARKYFAGPHFPKGSQPAPSSLETAVTKAWGSGQADAVDWRERLQSQLRDGSFHYIAVAQRFTRPVLRTVEYLNATMKAARFSAVELVRFSGEGYGAFEARFVAGAGPSSAPASSKASLAGIEDFVESVTHDDYRHSLQDLFEALAKIDDLTVFWGTTGCSLRVTIPGRSPLSVGWLFPPGPQRWMGLSDVTLGWYEDANGLALPSGGKEGQLPFSVP